MLSTLFCEICPSCAGSTARGFCAVCDAQLRRVVAPCRGCGLALPVTRCPRQARAWPVERVVAPLHYAAPFDDYLHALKYRGARKLGRSFGLLLASALDVGAVEALVPVPLHARRHAERGYNQAAEIARTVGAVHRLPVLLGGIRRVRADPPQTGQSAQARRANVAAAFVVERGVRGLRLAVVDDVITTGATVNSLAAALLAAGAAGCEAWAVARTPEL